MTIWDLLGWIVFGLIAGWIAKWLTPGDDPQGCIYTSIIGILGAVIGGWLMSHFGGANVDGFNIKSFAVAVLGSIVLLVGLRLIRGTPPA